MATRARRGEQASATRAALLSTAERLFAQRGVHAVSTREISAAAGQGNNAAVNYHFGTKDDLLRTIVRQHAEPVEARRAEMIASLRGSTELRDWVGCAVRPVTDHLHSLGTPSWYARLIVHVTSDPELRLLVADEFAVAAGASRQQFQQGLHACVPELPTDIRIERAAMTFHLITQMTAARELALAEGESTARSSWDGAASGLIDAIVGLLRAPITPSPDRA